MEITLSNEDISEQKDQEIDLTNNWSNLTIA